MFVLTRFYSSVVYICSFGDLDIRGKEFSRLSGFHILLRGLPMMMVLVYMRPFKRYVMLRKGYIDKCLTDIFCYSRGQKRDNGREGVFGIF